MLHAAVTTLFAAVGLVHVPIEGRARALLAEVTGKRLDIEETDEGEKFTNAVLQRGSRQAPFVICLKGKTSFGGSSGALLSRVSIEDKTRREILP